MSLCLSVCLSLSLSLSLSHSHSLSLSPSLSLSLPYGSGILCQCPLQSLSTFLNSSVSKSSECSLTPDVALMSLTLPSPSLHLSLNRRGRWGTTDVFTTSFLHFSLLSTTLWYLANSGPVHFLMLSSHLFFCLPCLFPPFSVPCKTVWARPDERETYPYHFSLCLFMFIRRSLCSPIAR